MQDTKNKAMSGTEADPGKLGGTLGRKGRPSRSTPKGRQVDPAALREVCDLLGDEPRRRDLLIEHLHRLQDKYGHLSARHLLALAEEMRLASAEVFEVASFYAHFDIVDDGMAPPAAITVRVCDGLSCELAGAQGLMESLRTRLEPHVRVVPAPCMGRCAGAPAVEVGHNHIDAATAGSVCAAVEAGHVHPRVPAYADFDMYSADGGYQLYRACLAGEQTPAGLMDILEASGLRGLGGAGFRSGVKWRIVAGGQAPRLMAINADEGEPGTFKDRHYLESDPHRILEGMLIAAWATGVEAIYIYLRDEYPAAYQILQTELARLHEAGLDGGRAIHLRRGAGAYICGEEAGMLESLEGKRGLPRHKPPYAAEVGLFGRPTLIHNPETLYWVRDIVERGPEWFANSGTNGGKGLRAYSVSGRVRSPGVKVAPAGVTARTLINDYCGGMADGHSFKAYLPGGASGGILPASMADIPLDFGTLEEHGCFIGSAAVVVLSEDDSIRAAALNLMRFFSLESCGQCTPCRIGTEKAVSLMDRPVWDQTLLADLSQAMRDASICGLGQAAPNPLVSAMRFFPDEI